MASGVTVDDDCKTCYENLKLRKDHRYIIYKMSDDNKRIIIEKEGNREESYEDFIEMLKSAETKKEGRYAVYDCEYDKKNPNKSKLVFIMWAPDSLPVKQKMLYAASKDYLKKKLVGLNLAVEATDMDDIMQDKVEAQCEKLDNVKF